MAVNARTHKHSTLGFTQEATLFLLLLTISAAFLKYLQNEIKSCSGFKDYLDICFSKEIGLVHYEGLQIYFMIANDYDCCSPPGISPEGKLWGSRWGCHAWFSVVTLCKALLARIRIFSLLTVFSQCW